jgi:hypothetical protein
MAPEVAPPVGVGDRRPGAGGVGVAVGQVSGAIGRAVPDGVAADGIAAEGATVGMGVPDELPVGENVGLPSGRPQAPARSAATSENQRMRESRMMHSFMTKGPASP